LSFTSFSTHWHTENNKKLKKYRKHKITKQASKLTERQLIRADSENDSLMINDDQSSQQPSDVVRTKLEGNSIEKFVLFFGNIIVI